jgi:hypothetical protein
MATKPHPCMKILILRIKTNDRRVLVIIGHDPAQPLGVTLDNLTNEINIFTGDTELALIVTFLPAILPQPDMMIANVII